MDTLSIKKIDNWHAREIKDAAAVLLTDKTRGLTAAEAKKRLKTFGRNKLPEAKKESEWKRFFKHFHDLLIYIMLFGAAVTAFLGHTIDTAAILVVVVINAFIGYFQENKAETALQGIRKMLALQAHVLRDGTRDDIPATDLVPGDMVLLKPGDRVPADIRLFSVANLRIEESALTGEAVPAEKSVAPLAPDTVLGDRTNMAYSGSTVSAGTGTGVVAATGADTEVGRINRMMAAIEPMATPLLKQISAFGKTVATIILVGCSLVFLAGLAIGNHETGDLLLSSIALAIGAIPEGLPAVVSIILALGVQSMARRKAIVRNLPSVETLGSVSVICSDKTGTLTHNEMTVRSLVTEHGEYAVSGTGYAPEGAITRLDVCADVCDDRELNALLTCFRVCNDAVLARDEAGNWTIKGDPTEGALATLWAKAGVQAQLPETVSILPFDSEYKYMAVLASGPEGDGIYIKGAPENLLELCGGEAACPAASRWVKESEKLAAVGMRTLAAAYKPHSGSSRTVGHADISGGIVFLGLAGIIDPPRDEAVKAVAVCQKAGITVKMITGDHAITARVISREMGIGDGVCVTEGRDINGMDDEELKEAVMSCDVFARTSPEHKLRLVRALQANGRIVAMTGDGVNDAPALKMADIGVAMGIKGTEVTKEAAGIVLADDNFESIAAAVEEGRKVYDNLRKTLLFILPTNLAESVLIVAGILFGSIMILTPVQVLWINLVTTLTISLALVFEPIEEEAMNRPPREPKAPLISRYGMFRLVYVGLVMGGACLLLAHVLLRAGTMPLAEFRTVIVQAIVICECFFMFNMRSTTAPFYRNFFANKWVFRVTGILVLLQGAATYLPHMNAALGMAPLAPEQWIAPFAVGLVLFILVEIEKYSMRAYLAARTR